MGSFEHDLQHGQGRCLYADGSEYEGEWRKGGRCDVTPLGAGGRCALALCYS